MNMGGAGVILSDMEEKHVVTLMMWLQNHHNVSYVSMISYRDVVDVLADTANISTNELLYDRLDDLVTHTGASLIVVVDFRSAMKDKEKPIRNRERLIAARQQAQAWFPDLTVIGLSVDERFRILSEPPDDHLRAG